MKNLYLEILERISKIGIGQQYDISDLFKNYETEQSGQKETQSDIEYRNYILSHPRRYLIRDFLSIMKDNGHLTFEDNTPELKGNVEWVMPIEFSAQITKEGLDYYYNRQLQISILKINNASVINYKSQRLFTIGALFFTLLTAIMSIFTFITTRTNSAKSDQIQKDINTDKQELKALQHKVDSSLNQKASLVEKYHK